MKHLLVLALLVTGFYWKLVLSDQYTYLQAQDVARQWLPWMTFQAAEWHAGRIPLWDPNHWVGQPLLAQAQPGTANPLHWILFSLPLRDGWMRQDILHAYFVFLHILAAWAAYALARDLGCRPSSSMLAGCVYALSGWMTGVDWPHMVASAVPAPLVLMYLLRVWRGDRTLRSAVLGGFLLGLSWLSGHHHVPISVSLLAACLLAARHAWRAGLLFFAVALATGALQIVPAMEYARLAVRWVGVEQPVTWQEKVPYDVHRSFHLAPVDLLGILLPGVWNHVCTFLGSCALTFAVLGAALSARRREVRVLLGVAAGALLMAMAGYSVFHGVLYAALPMLDKARNASWYYLLFQLAAATLAALGLEAWLRQADEAWRSRLLRAAGLFAAAVFSFLAVRALLTKVPFSGDDRVAGVALAALVTAGLLRWRDLPPRLGAACFLGLSLFEAGLVNTADMASRSTPNRHDEFASLRDNSDIFEFLRRQAGQPRFEVSPDLIEVNAGDYHGIQQLNGFLASVTENTYRFDSNSPEGKNLLGVAFAIAKEPTPQFTELVFTGRTGLKVFRNPAARPRAWIESSPPCPTSASAYITSYLPNSVRVKIETPCPGALVLSDTYYPGWRAAVNGSTRQIRQVHGALRSVDIPAGASEVVFRFQPASVYLGAALSALGALSALLVWWRTRSAYQSSRTG